jgi:hypothetical protein
MFVLGRNKAEYDNQVERLSMSHFAEDSLFDITRKASFPRYEVERKLLQLFTKQANYGRVSCRH